LTELKGTRGGEDVADVVDGGGRVAKFEDLFKAHAKGRRDVDRADVHETEGVVKVGDRTGELHQFSKAVCEVDVKEILPLVDRYSLLEILESFEWLISLEP
jgi:hypothetical protein